MGVIKLNDRRVEIKSSVSEETLYIPSSDDDRSEISVAVRHAQSRILQRQRQPTVGSTGFSIKPNSGKKKSRRYHNASVLETLGEDDEVQEVSITDFVDSTRTPFTRLFQDEDSRQKWDDFVSSSEETQQRVIKQDIRNNSINISARPLNANLRTLIKKRSVPLGMLNYLEEELISFFSSMPRNIYISPRLSSFERLLLHSLSDYHCLISLSFDAEPDKVRLVQVKNPKTQFPEPAISLTKYLETVYLK